MRESIAVVTCAAALTGAAAGQEVSPRRGQNHAAFAVSGGQLVARPLASCKYMKLTVRGPRGLWKRADLPCSGPGAVALSDPGAEPASGTYTFELYLVGGGPEADAGTPRRARGRFRLGDGDGALVLDGLASGGPEAPLADVTISDATPQLVFDDTDGGATDWQAHTVSNGAVFGIQNLSNGISPFEIEADAPESALYVASDNANPAIGFGTTTPVRGLHLSSSFVPSVILEAQPSGTLWMLEHQGGFFSISDGGSPAFILTSNAPGRSLQIDSTGNVAAFADNSGFGGNAAGASLHVKRSNGTAKLLVEETNPTVVGRNMLQTKNNGPSTFRFDNTATGQAWGFGSLNSGNFFIGSTPGQTLALTVTPAGNLSITGTLSQGSDRASKTDIEAADAREVLEKVAALPVSTWRYKGDEARHVGPMAQDFAALFGLGADDTHIAPGDMAGLALAAIQALREDAQAKDARIRELESRLLALEAGAPRR